MTAGVPYFTEDHVRRLLRLLDSGKERNWEWLATWIQGQMRVAPYFTVPGTFIPLDDADTIISAFENDINWEGSRYGDLEPQ